MSSILYINGTAIGRCGSDGLVLNRFSISMDGPDCLEFTQISTFLPGEFRKGQTAGLVVDGTTVFSGVIVSLHPSGTGRGPISVGYRCYGLNWLANQVWITATDGTGKIAFNLPESDPNYVPSMSALTVGGILSYLYNLHATQLGLVGITYPSTATTNDLGYLTLVPPDPIIVTGRLWNCVQEIMTNWYNSYGSWVTAAGVIRHENLLTLPNGTSSPVTLTLDSDPVVIDSISEDFSECYTQVVIRGAGNIQGAILSLSAGTLIPAWSYSQQSSWTYGSYINPSGASESGTCTTSATTVNVTAFTPSVSHALNSWTGTGAEVWVFNLVGGAAVFNEQRRISSNSATSGPGGSYTITVDVPFANSGYTNYSVRAPTSYAGTTNLSDVWRKFYIVPSTVSNHLVQQFSHSVPWTGGVQDAVVMTTTPMGEVSFPNSGNAISWPMPIQVVPWGTGSFTTQAVTTCTVTSNKVTAIATPSAGANQGTGYPPNSTSIPITFFGGGGSGAYGYATSDVNGKITAVTLTGGSQGNGYTSTPTVEIGVQTGYIEFYQPICAAYCTNAQMWAGMGSIPSPTDVVVLVPYSTGALTAQAPYPTAGALATLNTSGAVSAINVVGAPAGSGYPVSSTTIPVYVEPSNGTGTGYTTTATSDSSGRITAVATGSGGSGFTAPPNVWIMPTGQTYPWYMGTANSVNGVQRTLYLDYPEWLDYSQQSNYIALAQQKLNCVMNTVIEGSLTYYGKASSFFSLGQALNITGNGYTTGYEAINAPARSVVLDFVPDGGAVQWVTRISFSTRMKPFTGDRLYAHSNYLAQRSLLRGSVANLAAGLTGQVFGGTDFSGGDWATRQDQNLAVPGIASLEMSKPEHARATQIDEQVKRQRELAATMRAEALAQRGPDPAEPVDNTAADEAQVSRRERARLHTSEGSYNEARWGSEQSQGLHEDEVFE